MSVCHDTRAVVNNKEPLLGRPKLISCVWIIRDVILKQYVKAPLPTKQSSMLSGGAGGNWYGANGFCIIGLNA